jgi:hypothetical protein
MIEEVEGKEYLVSTDTNYFQWKVGTVDNFMSPTSLYLMMITWVYDDEDNYEYLSGKLNHLIKKFRYYFKQNIDNLFDKSLFDKDYIIDIKTGLENYNKSNKLHLKIELQLYLKNNSYPLFKGSHLYKKIQESCIKMQEMECFKHEDCGLYFNKKRFKNTKYFIAENVRQ